MILTNKKGFALVASLMVALIFLALGLALMLSVKGTLRQADTGRNNLIAYNLAEAGIADALFRLNYSSVGGNFPFTASVNPLLATSDISTTNIAGDTLQTIDGQLVIRDGGVIYRAYSAITNTGDYYRVRSEEIPPAGSNHWKLISEGFYKGSYKKIEVRLRGNQFSVQDRQTGPAGAGTQGIAEAFNKHTIYANTVNGNPAPPGTSVTGNITCFVPPVAGEYSGDNSLTTINAAIAVPAPNDPWPPAGLPQFNLLPAGDFFQNGRLNGVAPPATLPVGVTYSGSSVGSGDVYTFNSTYAGNVNKIDVLPASGEYDVAGTALGGPAWDSLGDVRIDEAPISNYLRAAGSITLRDSNLLNATLITFSGVNTALESVAIFVNPGISIDGDLIVSGAALTLDNVIVNGAVCSDNNITLSGTASTINAALPLPLGSSRAAAILVRTLGTSIITVRDVPPSITVGPTQTAAIFAYSTGGAVRVNINAGANFNPTYAATRTDQAAIISYSSPGGGTAIIDINANIGDGIPPVGRLIYASGTMPGTSIDLRSGIVRGCVVTNDTVSLTGGSLIYDSASFVTAPIPADIFAGFTGGRRVYLPAIGGWK